MFSMVFEQIKLYMVVFFALAFLTVVELFIPGMDYVTLQKGIALTVIAVVKAFLVAYYFMHLNEERPWPKVIVAIPILATLYAYVLVIEGLYR